MDLINSFAEIEEHEEALRTAMLSSDLSALSSLIDDGLVFTAPDGTVLNKAQDLSAHETGVLKLSQIALSDGRLQAVGNMVLVTAKADLAGRFGDVSIDGHYAYTRLWSQASGRWRVIAGHASRIG